MSNQRSAGTIAPDEPGGWNRPTAGYLAEARESGRVFRLDGAVFVAAVWTDDLTGLRKGYVEWADPGAMVADRRQLVAAAAAEQLDVDDVLLRVAPGPGAGDGCRYRTRYVAAAATDELAGPAPSDVLVREPAAEERDTVQGWLALAAADAYSGFLESTDSDLLYKVRELFQLDDADTGVLVAILDDRPVGHVTWLRSRSDDLTGTVHDELVDMLVEPGVRSAGAARTALLAGLGSARTPGLPLLGNVSFDDGSAGSVYERLLSGPWRPAYDLVEWSR